MNGMFNLEGKVAIVTGGNGGIGKGIARGFAAAGSDIVIVARDQEKTDEAASEIQADFGVRMLGLKRDLREESQIQDMIEPVVKEFGRIDILVNNAGIISAKCPRNMQRRNGTKSSIPIYVVHFFVLRPFIPY